MTGLSLSGSASQWVFNGPGHSKSSEKLTKNTKIDVVSEYLILGGVLCRCLPETFRGNNVVDKKLKNVGK